MSGRGEVDEQPTDSDGQNIALGQSLYTEEGHEVGTIRGMEERGVFVTLRHGIESLSVEHARSGHAFGEAELMWRCTNCGEMGEIDDDLPPTCPNCDVPKTELMYWTED